MAKTKKEITLKKVKGNGVVKLAFDHALTILRNQAIKGKQLWVIEEKNYIFKDNEIINKPSDKRSKKSEEQE